jgi:hypothetical protein
VGTGQGTCTDARDKKREVSGVIPSCIFSQQRFGCAVLLVILLVVTNFDMYLLLCSSLEFLDCCKVSTEKQRVLDDMFLLPS